VKLDGLADELHDITARLTDSYAAREVGYVRSPTGVASLDHNHVPHPFFFQ
jgi:hypothetical protein